MAVTTPLMHEVKLHTDAAGVAVWLTSHTLQGSLSTALQTSYVCTLFQPPCREVPKSVQSWYCAVQATALTTEQPNAGGEMRCQA